MFDYEMLGCILEDNFTYSTWLGYLIDSVRMFFPFASLINLSVISLERLHASFLQIRHRLLKKWVHGVMIAAIWVSTLSREHIPVRFQFYAVHFDINTVLAVYFLHFFVSLFICISCDSISIKVRCSRRLYHGANGGTDSEG